MRSQTRQGKKCRYISRSLKSMGHLHFKQNTQDTTRPVDTYHIFSHLFTLCPDWCCLHLLGLSDDRLWRDLARYGLTLLAWQGHTCKRRTILVACVYLFSLFFMGLHQPCQRTKSLCSNELDTVESTLNWLSVHCGCTRNVPQHRWTCGDARARRPLLLESTS